LVTPPYAGYSGYIIDITHSPATTYPNEGEVTVKMPYPDVARLLGDELARPPKP